MPLFQAALAWWADYFAGATQAYIARAGRLRTPILAESVSRLSLRPRRPLVVGMDLGRGPDRAMGAVVQDGKVIRSFEVVRNG